jgi:uncharacterized protein YndB with AHSA1/START domain
MTASARANVSRYIPADPTEVYAAWTDPEIFSQWWGPTGVTCIAADLDVVVDGRYRIGNALPDGSEVWIVGRYLQVDPPDCLRYTWAVEPVENYGPESVVTVRFSPSGAGTEVEVIHEQITSDELRDNHQAGWYGCLDGLFEHFTEMM